MKDDKNSPIKAFLILLLVLIFIVTLVVVLPIACGTGACDNCTSSCNSQPEDDEKGGFLTRKATVNDIDFDYSIEVLNLSVKIYVIPKVDIDDLALEISFYNSDRDRLKTMVKALGNVKEGERTEFTVSLIEFSIPQMLTINYIRCDIESGTVSAFS